MAKDFFHESVLQFKDWAENQPGLSGRTWSEIFDLKRVEEAYLERWNLLNSERDRDEDSWFVQTRDERLAAIRAGDALATVPLYRIIFHETGLINPEDMESSSEDKQEEMAEKINLMNFLDQVCVEGGKDFLLNAIQTAWKDFHRVVNAKVVSDIKENELGIYLRNVSRIWFDDGEVLDQGGSTEQYYQCTQSLEAWQRVMGDVLESVWRREKGLDESQLLSTDDGVLVKLVNGKMFVVSSSEWGSIDPLFVIGPEDQPIAEQEQDTSFKP